MVEDTTKNTDTSMKETLKQGEEASEEDGENTEEEETTAEGVSQNNPEDNKKLAEITMMEELRKTFNLKVTISRILQNIHTNQFFFIDVTDEFYEKNYPTIINVIANTKFARFAGFQKGRFFIEKIEEKGGMDGWETKLTLNPIPPSYALYSQKQKEAQKALIRAINQEISLSNKGGGGGAVSGNVDLGSLEEIYSIAATFTYGGAGTGLSPEKAWEHYQTGARNFDCYDCSNWLFYCLRAKGIPCRIVQGSSPSSSSGTHRVVQINDGTWHCPQQAWNLTMNLRPFTPEDKYPLTPKLTFDGTNTIEGG